MFIFTFFSFFLFCVSEWWLWSSTCQTIGRQYFFYELVKSYWANYCIPTFVLAAWLGCLFISTFLVSKMLWIVTDHRSPFPLNCHNLNRCWALVMAMCMSHVSQVVLWNVLITTWRIKCQLAVYRSRVKLQDVEYPNSQVRKRQKLNFRLGFWLQVHKDLKIGEAILNHLKQPWNIQDSIHLSGRFCSNSTSIVFPFFAAM